MRSDEAQGIITKVYEERKFGTTGRGWICREASHRVALVFVHGWGGAHDATWTWSEYFRPEGARFWNQKQIREVSLFKLLIECANLPCDFFTVQHGAGVISRQAITTLAGGLRTFLANSVQGQHVILVAHSLGGLVCRQAIVEMLEDRGAETLPVLGLVMFGTPNIGTEVARLAVLSKTGLEMRPFEQYLKHLNRRWVELVVNGGDPDGDIGRRRAIRTMVVLGEKDSVVPEASASALSHLGDIEVLLGKTHVSLVKAANVDDPTFQVLCRFVDTCVNDLVKLPTQRGAEVVAAQVRSVVQAGDAYEVEREVIELGALPSGEPAVIGPGWLACHCKCLRKGVRCQRSYRIRFRVNNAGPSVADVAYTAVLGSGLLSDEAFQQISSLIQSVRDSGNSRSGLLAVESLRVTCGTTGVDYVPQTQNTQSGAGWIVLEYEDAQEELRAHYGQSAEWELSIRFVLHRQQGWYRYFTGATILDELDVQVVSPFRTCLLPGWLWQESRLVDTRVGSRYVNGIVVHGPVLPDSGIDWVFQPEATNGKEEEEGRQEKRR